MTRRAKLDSIAHEASTHAGLWLDKFLVDADEAGAKANLIREASKTDVPVGYREAFEARRAGFMHLAEKECVRVFRAKALGRLVIGLGEKGVLEAGLRLEHTWGVPILPGSSLKGLAAATAHLLVEDAGWRKRSRSSRPAFGGSANTSGEARAKNSHDTLFGTTDDAGAVVFHDAWWIPQADPKQLPIDPDVMTVHHPKYYAGEDVAPSDFDSPVPVPFATVRGAYLVVLEGETEWTEAAGELLGRGLAELGIGAKTNAGYGRMTLEQELTDKQRERAGHAKEQTRRREGLLRAIDAPLPSSQDLPSRANDRVQKLRDAETAGVEESVLRASSRALYDVNPKWWSKTWRANPKRTDEERAFFDRYVKPRGQ